MTTVVTVIAPCRSKYVASTMALIALLMAVGACSPQIKPSIETRQPPPSERINVHEVQAGETLYSIAWRYEQDYREMARINGLGEPYLIGIGQRLKIRDDGQPPLFRSTPVAGTSASTSASADKSKTKQVTKSSAASGASAERSESVSGAKSNATKSAAIKTKNLARVDRWAWPISGRIVKSFGADQLTKGILIDPSGAKTVTAGASGTVVYSGTGIRGIGNLVIVKHSDLYLSAYAYNETLLVDEGEVVKIGQKIAIVGKDSTGKDRLYFEIREDGRPVDPIRFLPKR